MASAAGQVRLYPLMIKLSSTEGPALYARGWVGHATVASVLVG